MILTQSSHPHPNHCESHTGLRKLAEGQADFLFQVYRVDFPLLSLPGPTVKVQVELVRAGLSISNAKAAATLLCSESHHTSTVVR